MGRSVAVIVLGVVKAVTRAKEQARYDKQTGQNEKCKFDIHNSKGDVGA